MHATGGPVGDGADGCGGCGGRAADGSEWGCADGGADAAYAAVAPRELRAGVTAAVPPRVRFSGTARICRAPSPVTSRRHQFARRAVPELRTREGAVHPTRGSKSRRKGDLLSRPTRARRQGGASCARRLPVASAERPGEGRRNLQSDHRPVVTDRHERGGHGRKRVGGAGEAERQTLSRGERPPRRCWLAFEGE